MDLNSPFELNGQHENVRHKIAVVLSKLSDSYRQLLWSRAQPLGISPIQVQLLIYVKHHTSSLNTVSHLASEFQMTKATISDSIKVLVTKGLLEKVASEEDRRSFHLKLTTSGKSITEKAEGYTREVQKQLSKMDDRKAETLFQSLYELLDALNEEGVIPVQRMCFGCIYYRGDKATKHHCTLLKKKLQNDQIRIDCAEFEAA